MFNLIFSCYQLGCALSNAEQFGLNQEPVQHAFFSSKLFLLGFEEVDNQEQPSSDSSALLYGNKFQDESCMFRFLLFIEI